MNILYITSEAAPFCKTGGLADVLGSLPPAVASEGDHAAVLLPLYSQIAQRWREKMNFRCYIYVDLGWPDQSPCTIWRCGVDEAVIHRSQDMSKDL